MRGKRTKTFAGLAILICIGMVLLWAVSMGCMTYVLAKRNYDIIQREANNHANDLIVQNQVGTSSTQSYFVYDMLWMLCSSDVGPIYNSIGGSVRSAGAVIVTDVYGNIQWYNRDFLRFEYVMAENWEARRKDRAGWAWIDLELDAELKACIERLQPYDKKFRNWWNLHETALRITGYLEDDRMIPVKIEHAEHAYHQDWPVSDWMPLYEIEADNEKELITVCTEFPLRYEFDEKRQVRFHGKDYANLLELRKQKKNSETQWSLKELVLFDSAELIGPGGESYTVSSVLAFYPLEGAVRELMMFYIWTFAFLVVLVGIALVIVHRNLIRPLAVLDAGFFGMVRSRPSWAEPEMLAQQMEELDGKIKERNDQLRKKDNEIFRLNQSIEYARKAEENRRQLVSGVAHELKTPLAIISGYTEGLQEKIAEERKEEYLEIILSETRRMDGLVMEMLELSRLEAGKITLARDEFDLSAMIRDVFAKLGREAEQKRLRVELELRLGTPVYADEGRMEQIIRNLASNAVRYTQEGGCIRVSTERLLGNVEVRMYNDAQAFSEEALSKVWEVFYRTDSARHGKGTGLGLAITKNLVQLHGGSCGVRNVPGGVEFSFRIPQKY